MFENVGGQYDVDLSSRHVDDVAPHQAKRKIKDNCEQQPDRQGDEGGHGAVGDDAVVDVHDEQRRRQGEHVHDECRDGDVTVICPELADGRPEPVRSRETDRVVAR